MKVWKMLSYKFKESHKHPILTHSLKPSFVVFKNFRQILFLLFQLGLLFNLFEMAATVQIRKLACVWEDLMLGLTQTFLRGVHTCWSWGPELKTT